MSIEYAKDKVNPLADTYQRTYGDKAVVAKPLPIADIRPDLSQPRRAIPAAVRGEWDGDGETLPAVLGAWHARVEALANTTVNLPALLVGNDNMTPTSGLGEPVVSDYLELLSLAASIHIDGLQEPIKVVRRGDRWDIESGERRWLAHWLLHLHVGGEYETILATEKARFDVWAQAAENGARAPLNAIGMARQIALLVMDMYQGDDGVKFDAYAALVLPGACDRPFYAQVANGNIYRVKKGMGQRVLDVTGLKAGDHIRKYRALLSIDDDLWRRADEDNLTEWDIRQEIDANKPVNADTVPYGTVLTVQDGQLPVVTVTEPAQLAVGDRVQITGGKIETVVEIDPTGRTVRTAITGWHSIKMVAPVAPPLASAATSCTSPAGAWGTSTSPTRAGCWWRMWRCPTRRICRPGRKPTCARRRRTRSTPTGRRIRLNRQRPRQLRSRTRPPRRSSATRCRRVQRSLPRQLRSRTRQLRSRTPSSSTTM